MLFRSVSYDEQQDLLQAGNLALCKAAMNYDNTRPFAVYDVDRFLSTLRRKRQQVVAQDESFDLYEIDLSDEDAAAE